MQVREPGRGSSPRCRRVRGAPCACVLKSSRPAPGGPIAWSRDGLPEMPGTRSRSWPWRSALARRCGPPKPCSNSPRHDATHRAVRRDVRPDSLRAPAYGVRAVAGVAAHRSEIPANGQSAPPRADSRHRGAATGDGARRSRRPAGIRGRRSRGPPHGSFVFHRHPHRAARGAAGPLALSSARDGRVPGFAQLAPLARAAQPGTHRGGAPTGLEGPHQGAAGGGHGGPRHRNRAGPARQAGRPRIRSRRDTARDFLDRAAPTDHCGPRSTLSRARGSPSDHPRNRMLCSPHMISRTRPRRSGEPERVLLQEVITTALDDMKAVNVKVLDVRGLTDIADTMVIASGNSDRHVRSIAERVLEKAKAAGFRALGTEGERDGEWVLVDLQDIVLHVMLPRVREFYGLERLWDHAEAPVLAAAQVPPTTARRGRRR